MTLQYLDGLEPDALGLASLAPHGFRTHPITGAQVQLEVVEFAAYCERRVAAACAPTGIGKRLAALALAQLTGKRTVILTGTKGLQSDYAKDGACVGLVEIKGKGNYQCGDYANLSCRDGMRVGCRYTKGKGCAYEQVKARARNAQIISANYAYWLGVNDKAQGLDRTQEEAEFKGENPVELLIMDEAHEAAKWLAEYMSVKLNADDVPEAPGEDLRAWKQYANVRAGAVAVEIEELEAQAVKAGKRVRRDQMERLHRAETLLDKLVRVARADEDEWVVERKVVNRQVRAWEFDVLAPGRFAEQYMLCGVPKVVMLSATMSKRTCGTLWLPESTYEFREWDRIFPAQRNPIYNIPARNVNGDAVRMRRGTSSEDLAAWVEWIDQIIDGRLDRKGIVQTVSYDRQRYIKEHSRHRDIMFGNTREWGGETAEESAEKFRKASAPALLVSPSFATGWDFPMQACEYIIVCKIPFKPAQSKAAKAREAKDKKHGLLEAMTELVQSCGRGMRSVEDRCEVFITDGNLGWFMAQNKTLGPQWFARAVLRVNEIPKAPPKL